ncbi:MAG: PD40 domain-containing protein [Flavobacteriales bacterium]|nr:PD40 domain-containing protein [Flavobacteriales bacterium]
MRSILLATSICIASGLHAQKKESGWDVQVPAEPHRKVVIETDEGTWMNLDVSPDGKTIVFDMLGDIYSMPVEGGEAKLLRGGHAFEVQPRFSPDGRHISFTSDAGGGDNIWVMRSDGSDARQITRENFRLLNNAVWTPDGNYLIARKHFTSQRSLGAGEMWIYHKSGGSGVQLTKRKNDQQDAGEPCVSPDGRYVYYSEDIYPGGYFQYNKDPNSLIYCIRRYDRREGKLETFISGPGGSFRPQISPDGKKLAFVRRVRTKTVLFVQDLETGEQKPVFDDLSKDQQEAWAIFGVYTNFNWCPDNEHVIIWAQGKIQKINTNTGQASVIPFLAKAEHSIVDALQFPQQPAPDNVQIKAIRQAETSPDGKYLVFNAAGHIWKKKLPNGKPERLTSDHDLEFDPAFSPDGKTVVYVTWNDETRGSIRKIPIQGGVSTKLTAQKGIYRSPSFSADGSRIVYQKEGGDADLGLAYCVNPGIYWMSADGGTTHFVTEDGDLPKFNASGDRIYFQTGGFLFGALDKSYHSIDLNGQDKKEHFHSSYANQFAISPDQKWLAFGELHNVYVMPFSETGKTFELSAGTKAYPVRKLSRDAGINLHWGANSKQIIWTLGDTMYRTSLDRVFTFVEGAPDSLGKIQPEKFAIGLELKADIPEGLLALVGATIITMNGEEVIENGIVLIERNRIKAIGKQGELNIPSNAKVIDVKGKVILPGFVDTHAHLRGFRYGISPQKSWAYYANLAYGITSTHDPSSNTEMTMSQSEMVRTGIMAGPRIFSTGTILYGADGDFKAEINDLDDARSAIRRTKAFGTFSVKSYNQPRREQRQQVIKAAREERIMVYPEGGSTFYHNLTMILDGHTSIEHNLPIAPLYKDVIELWSASKTANTPTLIVNYGSLSGENYWYQTTNVWENEKLLQFTPRAVIDSRARHRTMAPMEEYENGHILTARSCKKLVDAGVHMCVGGHGQLQGLGVHWEIWNLAQGGLTSMECLRAATIHGAAYIGMEKDLGSIEAGKLADLIVLDEDPRQDIRNTNSVRYTMINGRLYESSSMHEIGNHPKERSKFYWELDGASSNFPWHEGSRSFEHHQCSCRH